PTAVRTLLPVTDDRLVAGIAGVVREAARQQAVLDAAADRLAKALSGALEEDEGPIGPSDGVLHDATSGIGGSQGYWWSRPSAPEPPPFRALRVRGRAPRRTDGPAVRLHFDGPAVPVAPLGLETLLDHRAA